MNSTHARATQAKNCRDARTTYWQFAQWQNKNQQKRSKNDNRYEKQARIKALKQSLQTPSTNTRVLNSRGSIAARLKGMSTRTSHLQSKRTTSQTQSMPKADRPLPKRDPESEKINHHCLIEIESSFQANLKLIKLLNAASSD